MPSSSANAKSAMTGLGLFLTCIVLWYLNSTTSNLMWSTIYVIANGLISLAMVTKLAAAFGDESKASKVADYAASIAPFVALYFTGIQALFYKADGMTGFMAGLAITALVVNVRFGLFDAFATWGGKKWGQLQTAAHEAQNRLNAVAEAARGSNPRN